MDLEPRREDFAQYERLLWHVLGSLSRRGYFVPPDEARDVLHDFYVEAWRGLEQRFDPEYGTFSAYVAGSFYRFARRRLVEMNQWRNMLDDLSVLEESPSPNLGPADIHEEREAFELIQRAVASLPRVDRQLLQAYVAADEPSERVLAANHSLTRYEVRRRLASAMATIAQIVHASPSSAHSEVLPRQRNLRSSGRKTTSEGSPRPAAAQSVADLILFERIAGSEKRKTMETTSQPDAVALLKAVLLSEQAPLELERMRDVLRNAFAEQGSEVEFTQQELEYLEKHPERLSQFYELLAGREAKDAELSEVEKAIRIARGKEISEIDLAFEQLVRQLPGYLKDWHQVFGRPETSDLREFALSLRSGRSQRLSAELQGLLDYGLVPETVAGVVHGLQLLFDAHVMPRGGSPVSWQATTLQPETLRVEWEDGEAVLPLELVAAQIATTPNLPLATLANPFVDWILDVSKLFPNFVPGYEYRAGNGATFYSRPNTRDYELLALWARRTSR